MIQRSVLLSSVVVAAATVLLLLLGGCAQEASAFVGPTTAAPRTLFGVVQSFSSFQNQAVSHCSTSTCLPVKIKVEVGDSEPIESALRRFKREVNKSGHLMELRHRRYFENSQEKAKRKLREGRIRKKFERMQRRRQNQNSNGSGSGSGSGSSISSSS